MEVLSQRIPGEGVLDKTRALQNLTADAIFICMQIFLKEYRFRISFLIAHSLDMAESFSGTINRVKKRVTY